MIIILFFRPFGASYPFISLTKGFTPGYMLSTLRAYGSLEEASVKLRFASIKETYSTGSYPEPPKGLHLSTRHIPRQTPHSMPFFSTASIIY